MGVALSMKVTAFIFLPAYLACFAAFDWRKIGLGRTLLNTGLAAFFLFASCLPMAGALRRLQWRYYPAVEIQKYLARAGFELRWLSRRPHAVDLGERTPTSDGAIREHTPVFEIANHPGDLRSPRNFLVYGGGILWAVVGMGLAIAARDVGTGKSRRAPAGGLWALGVGCWYITIAGYHLRTAPDARFFLAGIPFVLLPLTGYASRFPWRRFWLPALVFLSLAQGGLVLAKVSAMRRISPGIREAAQYVEGMEEKGSIFMYPEGTYRLFPQWIDWYLGYRLRDFWRADNDERIRMLQDRGIAMIIVKKNRIRPVGADTHDLGVYPRSFAEDVDSDTRFGKVYENSEVIIYTVPQHNSAALEKSSET